MPWKKGESGNFKGRKLGAVNVFTKTVKETVLEAFQEAQLNPKTSFKTFLRNHPREAMAICAKLIPTEVKAEVRTPDGIQIQLIKDQNCKPIGTDPDEGNAGL